MSRNRIRQTHRWESIAFTALSAAIFLMATVGRQPVRGASYLALLPLGVLVLGGLSMFFAPYAARRARHHVGPSGAIPS